MKFTRSHAKALGEFIGKMNADGALPVNEWTSGKGQHTKNRALPPFVARYERKPYPANARPQRGTPERVAYDFFRASGNEKRKFVLVLDRKALQDFTFANSLGKEIDSCLGMR